jgi:ribosomal protein S18 acetylase RimI-like enzyme
VNAQLGAVTAEDLRASFRGDVYGDAAAMTAEWFRDHVERNDIEVGRSPRWTLDGKLAGAALLGFRRTRAWVGAFGVVLEFRGRGLARRYLQETLAIAREFGAVRIELEVLENNPVAVSLYERAGFETVDELVVWSRAPVERPGWFARPEVGEARHFDRTRVAAIARSPSTCWQREPSGVAAASPVELIAQGAADAPAAYAFVRRTHADASTILDAGASDRASAEALFAELDLRVRRGSMILLNEPPRGPLHDALSTHPGWRVFARQRRMRRSL